MFEYLDANNLDLLVLYSLGVGEKLKFYEDFEKIQKFRTNMLDTKFNVGQKEKILYQEENENGENRKVTISLDIEGKLNLKKISLWAEDIEYNLQVDLINRPGEIVSWFKNPDISYYIEMFVGKNV